MQVEPVIVFILLLISLISARTCEKHETCIEKEKCYDTNDSWSEKVDLRTLDKDSCGLGNVCCNKAPDIAKKDDEGYKSCGTQRECVPRHLCKSGSINADGRYIVTLRISKDSNSGCGVLEECCSLDDQTKEAQDSMQRDIDSFQFKGCGYSNPRGLYYQLDGYKDGESSFAEFPWMVALIDLEGKYICGGTLIHPQLVLTSAHSVANYSKDSLLVRAGDWDLSSKTERLPHQERKIREWFRHEDFDLAAVYNDIALVVLERPFELAPHIQPICLPPAETSKLQEQLQNAHCVATGWGLKTSTSLNPEHLLKRIELPVLDHEYCQSLLRRTILGLRFRLHASFLCAGGVEGKDTCRGDGGSPLFCTMPGERDRYQLVGIVSWGIDCAVKDVPAAYANVAYLRNWIDKQVLNISLIGTD
ncbi:phenoloxidase-activating factor 2 [Drosophila gunungcola]|uniref:phenoloxidase-activating factor 2 n=1 Tax=Drosophila gunungcola TaxID=103775 RepID=UPI0022E59AC9|nr:phenoloxidase-activating factor 2 [Drosophila gunungcola]XP_052843505.1 phenoloxidase-activating factor 2 [Drosophila gunungcola]